ncbi:MAG TPA: aldo/keto reductase [Bdellovibrio sp.]|nr:aldo/keto reductase [Bdellovibrio sp.]
MNKNLERIGLGTWAFGGRAYGPMEDDVARAVVHRALDLGITFFDTAHIYANGRAEEILGECLPLTARVCTKLGYDLSSGKGVKNYAPAFLDQSLDISLKRLRREQIDLLLLHNPPLETLKSSGIYSWLSAKIHEGKIAQWGCSIYDSVEEAKLALDAGASAIEARYSLLRRDIIDDLPKEKWKFEFLARSPLDGGLLSGKYNGGESFPSTDQRSAMRESYFQTNRAYLNELQLLIDDGTVDTFAELAIRFVAFHQPISRVISGAKSVSQLEKNIQAVIKGPLPVKAIELINNLRKIYMPRLLNS